MREHHVWTHGVRAPVESKFISILLLHSVCQHVSPGHLDCALLPSQRSWTQSSNVSLLRQSCQPTSNRIRQWKVTCLPVVFTDWTHLTRWLVRSTGPGVNFVREQIIYCPCSCVLHTHRRTWVHPQCAHAYVYIWGLSGVPFPRLIGSYRLCPCLHTSNLSQAHVSTGELRDVYWTVFVIREQINAWSLWFR